MKGGRSSTGGGGGRQEMKRENDEGQDWETWARKGRDECRG